MARKKTSKKKPAKRNPAAGDRNKRIALVTATLLGAGAVFAGAAVGVSELDHRAARAIVPGSPGVVINWPVDTQGKVWLPLTERERLEQALARAVAGGSALSQAPLREAGLALASSGWVDPLPIASWTADGNIILDADWRVPAAAVRVGNREIIIDWDGVVLPIDYAPGQSNQYWFINPGAPLPRVGQQWVGADLRDGLALLRRLQKEDLLEQVDGFNLGDGPESGVIRIVTKRGTEIVWGAGPGRERPGEQPTGVKVERLRALYKRAGLIDGGFEQVDIRGADILTNRLPDAMREE